MVRIILIAVLAGIILLAFAAVPPMLPGSTTLCLSGSAMAQKTPEANAINLNSSRSNNYRMGGGGGHSTKKAGIAVSDPGVPNDPKPGKKTK
jgi:hypothetical protein